MKESTKFKVGDRVSFTNEKRDGIVKKILNNKFVSVEIEDGFDIPVLESELVQIILPDFIQNQKSNTKGPESFIAQNQGSPIIEVEDDDREVLNTKAKTNLDSGIYFAFIPENQKSPISASFNVYIVNNTNYDILFNYMLRKEGKYTYQDFDKIDEKSMFRLQTIDSTEIEVWSDVKFHVIYFKQDSHIIKKPEVLGIKIKPHFFYKDQAFEYEPLINACAFISKAKDSETIVEKDNWNDDYEKLPKNTPQKGLKIIGHINNINRIEPFPEKHLIERQIGEVDLHIDSLLDSIEGLTNVDMLKTQVAYFRKMLESALANKLKKIVFIHGVGNGKLKDEIRLVLKNEYPQMIIADASMAKYGVGATEVEIF